MGTRLERVEQLLRREIAGLLLEGILRDPRLANLGLISITAVRVSPDLAHARVFVDMLGEGGREPVLAALGAGAGRIQRALGGRIHLKRTPRLTFVADEAIERGNRIEQVLAEIHEAEAEAEHSDADEPEPEHT